MPCDLVYALEDPFLRKRLEEIVAEHDVKTIVETGLDKGLSAVEFSRMAPNYIGIDINWDCVLVTKQNLTEIGAKNFVLHVGNSPDVLKTLLADQTLFFLDAHCYRETDCPILEEIRMIPRGKGILVFHDIWPPQRKAGGFFPLIDGVTTRFDYALIKPELSLWSPDHRIEYLIEYPHELAPGVMFAFPG